MARWRKWNPRIWFDEGHWAYWLFAWGNRKITNSIIGLRSHIQKGTVIKKSILAPNHYYYRPENLKYLPEDFGIGQNCHIENAIIDEHVKIGNNVKLINKKKLDTFDGKGVYIRDGIIIVAANTHLPDNYILWTSLPLPIYIWI